MGSSNINVCLNMSQAYLCLVPMSFHSRQSDLYNISSSSYKATNPIEKAQPSLSHLILITPSQRRHLPMLSHCRLEFQHMDLRVRHSVHTAGFPLKRRRDLKISSERKHGIMHILGRFLRYNFLAQYRVKSFLD